MRLKLIDIRTVNNAHKFFYGYSYLLQGENYIESRPTNKNFLQSVRKQTEIDRKQKSGILDMSIPDTPEKVNNKPFPVSRHPFRFLCQSRIICIICVMQIYDSIKNIIRRKPLPSKLTFYRR